MSLRIEDCVNEVCPWSGDPVSADALTLYRGRVVGFCNPGCRDKFEAAAGAFDATIDRAVVSVEVLPHGEGLALPAYATEGAAGADLRAALAEPLTIPPGGTASVPTGLRVALPPSHEMQVRPRSGLAARHGVTVLNSPGTVDADYRGEVHVLLVNLGPEPFTIERGERVAQAVIAPVTQARFAPGELSATRRGERGFGSTGRG